ncbi:MAG TPA: DUF3857 domain-containing protein [Candidatus Acidoferrum sp.]|jgi:hypothetical protein
MLSRRVVLIVILGLAGLGVAGVRPSGVSAGDEWLPITPEELKMTSVAEAPGAPAVILYRQVDRDDSNADVPHEYDYVRIKILTEEGRKYGDVEIPYLKGNANINQVKGRTIRPDGSIANFQGKPFDKTIVKAKGLKYLAKTFSLPDVQVGSIIEYHYMLDLQEGYVFDSHWILSDELFTKVGKFTLKPSHDFALRWSWPIGLPAGTASPLNEHGIIHMESHNIPAFQIEDYMPPENELKFRVDFSYTDDSSPEKEADKFWKKEGKKKNEQAESFIGKHKSMEQVVAQTVSASDPPEVKLQKLYARVQQLRNTSYEVEKSEQEQKREKAKPVGNVEDVLKQGRGNPRAINWLFIALARAAGFEAHSVFLASRNQYFFRPEMMNSQQLNGDVVLVRVNGKDVYCDPGSKFAPFGLLPWEETAVQGLKLDKDGGAFSLIPSSDSSISKIERKADLKLDDEGTLSGKLTITFSGLEALERRTEERNEDETSRKKFLEDQVREYVPVGIDVELTNKPDWSSAAPTLVATYDLKVQGWASAAGHRALIPVGLFSSTEKQLFEHASRVHPVYFQYPFLKEDDVTIQLPLNWQVNSMPQAQNQDAKAAVYILKVENDKGALHLTRVLRSDLMLVDAKVYPNLRTFFQVVRTGDEEQVVLQPGASSGGK